MATSEIQNFNLFGETTDMPDVVHCEKIETRSLLHDWEFRPHRHARLHQVLVIEHGGGLAQLDTTDHDLKAGHFVNVPMGVVHGFRFHNTTRGWVLTLGTEIIDQLLSREEGLVPVLARAFVGDCSPEMPGFMHMLFEEYDARRFGRAHMLRMQAGLVIGLVARLLAQSGSFQKGRGGALLHQFEMLVEEHLGDRWSVSRFARELAVSPAHLSRISRAATGLSASQMIEARTLREARRMLAFTNLPINQIAFTLGYDDPAYFSRVFSRASGHSPRQFRAGRNDA